MTSRRSFALNYVFGEARKNATNSISIHQFIKKMVADWSGRRTTEKATATPNEGVTRASVCSYVRGDAKFCADSDEIFTFDGLFQVSICGMRNTNLSRLIAHNFFLEIIFLCRALNWLMPKTRDLWSHTDRMIKWSNERISSILCHAILGNPGFRSFCEACAKQSIAL